MRVPVIVVAGFLGSGKTSLLNHVLHNRNGVRVGVVVNDFGAINIDAMAISAQVDTMVSFGNGCLCCAIDTEDMGDTLAGLAEADVDVVLVEPSGLAEPQAVVRLVLANAGERLEYGGMLEVVDAAEFERVAEQNPDLERHLAFADLVVLNKIDLADEATLRRVRERIGATVPIVETVGGALDPQLLFDRSAETGPRQLSFDELEEPDSHEGHAHETYESVSFHAEEPLDPVLLMEFLRDRPPELFRVKGYTHFDVPGYPDRFGLQTVGRHLRFRREPWPHGQQRATDLVLIGRALDAGGIEKRLRGCLAEAPSTEKDLLDVLRYAH
ncbi:CobW family GTP-binding protein [Sciscionella sediminilitoris]|uniref:CobW family GTP-binding protein n=1 Tax=Sciscionella sediminilitoris TaxID=1445613 RepID=UPI0004DF8C62|nr:GTP-binding protein [Sciscionella sp. SE31]